MPFTLTMPKLSPTMAEGTIVKWQKQEGEKVEAGDVLFEVATDKATVEYNALDEGWLRKILIGDGGEAQVNSPVAIFTETKEESIEGYSFENKKASSPDSAPSSRETSPVKEAEKPLGKGERLLASPLAKKLAKEQGIDLSMISGSGPRGRIMSRDLTSSQKGRAIAPPLPAGSYEEEKLTPMRKVIAQRLQEAKATIPHFYISILVDAKALWEAREQLKQGDVKVTVNDFVIRATALALKEHPRVNSGFNGQNNTLILYKTIDISVAVNLENGLITPIIRQADFKSLTEISTEIKQLANRAKEGKLQEQEYKGGSFTISNLGMFGVSHFQAIINPPQSSNLAVGAILDLPVVKGDKIIPGKQMTLTLSADHRAVDGAAAAAFLQTLKTKLENPFLLVL